MAKVHTDAEALYEIREAVIKLGEQMSTAQSNFQRSFGQISDQISDHMVKLDSEMDSMAQDSDADGRTDSFCCQKCGGRIMLKIPGDETHCREAGCDGVARRVYDNAKVQENRRKRDVLEQRKEELGRTRNQLDDYGEYVISLLHTSGSAGNNGFNIEACVLTLDKWLETLGDYSAVRLSDDVDNESVQKKDKVDGLNTDNSTGEPGQNLFTPNRRSPRDLPVTQYGFTKSDNGNMVYDSPIETGGALCPKQGYARMGFKGTCGLCSCANVIRLSGVDVKEGNIIDYASKTNAPGSVNRLCETGHLNPASNGATSPADRKAILDHFGIDSGIFEMKRDARGMVSSDNAAAIAQYVSEGRGVIISVHAYALWHGKKNSKNDFHAITVTSVEKDAQGNIAGFYVCDTGIGGTQYYPSDVLIGSLTGAPMNVTYQIIR
ncbi:MAG: hypothetical protein NC121_07125 [Blautia sp.]|nr:hypothetical protein [Blautia sp.]